MDWLSITQGLLTIIIALTTTYIAYQQMSTNRSKLKYSLFDKRMEIYKEFVRFIWNTLERNFESSVFLRFNSVVNRIPFLLDDDIADLHKEMINKAGLLHDNMEKITSGELDPERKQELEEWNSEILNWFSDQFYVVDDKFKPYMNFESKNSNPLISFWNEINFSYF